MTMLRTKEQKRRDRSIIGRYYLQKLTQDEIRHRLKEETNETYLLSVPQISYDLKVIRRYWMMTAVESIHKRKNEELAKIDYLEKTYWDGWHRSIGEVVKTTTRAKRSGNQQEGQPQANVTRSESREVKVGDPRFLSGIQWCIQKRVELLGLDAPQKMILEQRLEEMGEKELAESLQLAEDVEWELVSSEKLPEKTS